ncbi:glycosyltransferase WbsX family protein [Phocaeicola barnesiae]|uniref:glycosyltransferase WbsX family protein n=1 Tax=Phocaeicola barnesiae TaxID=376804 RepID=UPI0025A4429F|nr:glycoside hydrolase family 99-like domain-containing protein [Phocaeicola barnesiae]MDM8310360.1 glycoside hydrolase family 99-like domain-containing protein [Phocaeicola barnesiae]
MFNKRIIAINLPQFHPFPENDEWWGKGFTEWTNVVKAKSRYLGHYEPHLPADTGFYDLRLPEARQMQADMAKQYGIYGFCYYHYWFNGKQLMEKPLNEILRLKEPNFPFMLCWANENWSRNWDGGYNKILIKQNYTFDDDIDHMHFLCKKYFSDSRYIRVDNKPVFIIYRPQYFPDISKTLKLWRNIASLYGLELYLIFTESPSINSEEYIAKGFDGAMNFQPACMNEYARFKNPLNDITHYIFKGRKKWFNTTFSYKSYVKFRIKYPFPKNYIFYPCVCPNFDNSPRRVGKPFWAFKGSTPQLFGVWLKSVLAKFKPYSKDENFVFINAWNEWAEGNHLEPDQKWGKAYLEEVKKAIEDDSEKNI